MFKFFGPQFWNSIPQEIRQITNYDSFKTKYKGFLREEV